jgi:hypothetical protein
MYSRSANPLWIALSILLALILILSLVEFDSIADRSDFLVRDNLTEDQYHSKFYKSKAEYQIWTHSLAVRAFEWNLRSTKYLFWVSMVVSLSGVAFAFWQFAQANRYDREQGQHDELAFKTHMASLSFKSRSVASLILFVSIAYLLIYAHFLYPVRQVPGPIDERTEETDGDMRMDTFDDEGSKPLQPR